MKHEPATMKKKADLMLKRGSISDAQHAKLHKKADQELANQKLGATGKIPPAKDVDKLSATGKGDKSVAATDVESGKDTATDDDPSKKRRKPGPDNLQRGAPADADL